MPAAAGAHRIVPSVRVRQFAAINALINGTVSGFREAAKEHECDRQTLAQMWNAMLSTGLLSTASVAQAERDALASAQGDVLGCLCKLAKGCVASLQALPTRPDQMDGMQMKQLKLSLDTLDRLGLLPNKAKDIAKKEGTGRLIDLVPMDELIADAPEPSAEQPSEPKA